jgi:hypothetical protein
MSKENTAHLTLRTKQAANFRHSVEYCIILKKKLEEFSLVTIEVMHFRQFLTLCGETLKSVLESLELLNPDAKTSNIVRGDEIMRTMRWVSRQKEDGPIRKGFNIFKEIRNPKIAKFIQRYFRYREIFMSGTYV